MGRWEWWEWWSAFGRKKWVLVTFCFVLKTSWWTLICTNVLFWCATETQSTPIDSSCDCAYFKLCFSCFFATNDFSKIYFSNRNALVLRLVHHPHTSHAPWSCDIVYANPLISSSGCFRKCRQCLNRVSCLCFRWCLPARSCVFVWICACTVPHENKPSNHTRTFASEQCERCNTFFLEDVMLIHAHIVCTEISLTEHENRIDTHTLEANNCVL